MGFFLSVLVDSDSSSEDDRLEDASTDATAS